MPTPYFVADSAQVTVMRSLASTAFGTYDLTLPEGITLEDLYTLAAPGNKLGYVASLGGPRVGGMARRFIRSDVAITTGGGEQAPATNVEEVLDAAAKRTSGDFFLETDISKAGLGPWVPFKDFQVGDKARVEIWGTVVTLPITRIDDDVVHVGGQLVSDADARLAENEAVRRALVDDRRDLFGLDEKIESSVSSARSDFSRDLSSTTRTWNSNLNAATGQWNASLNAATGRWDRELVAARDAIVAQLEQQKQDYQREYNSLSENIQKSIDDAEASNKKLQALTRALQGENQDLDTAARLVWQRINGVSDTANKAGDWVTKNQDDVNKAIALALSAQGKYNEFNNIKWLKDSEWKTEQAKINNSNDLFKRMQSQVNSLNNVQFIKINEWQKAQADINLANERFKKTQEGINEANQRFREAQEYYNYVNNQINNAQNRYMERLAALQQEMVNAQSLAVDELMATKAGANRDDARVTNNSDGTWTVHLPYVSGRTMVHTTWYTKGSSNFLTREGEKLSDDIGRFTFNPSTDYAHIRWTRAKSSVEVIDRSLSNVSVPRGSWSTIYSFSTHKSGGNLVIDATVTWATADRGSGYGVRIWAGDRMLGSEYSTELGPMTVFGDGVRSQSVSGTRANMPSNIVIEVQVFSNALLADSRKVKSATVKGTFTAH